jgi:hypothetical protein
MGDGPTLEEVELLGIKGWWSERFDDLHVTVYPTNDLIAHDTESDECVCGPTVEPCERDSGEVAWIYTHHALDGRE